MVDVDWSQLSEDLLRRIVEHHLHTYVEDFIIFSCVCHSWRHAAYGCDKSKLRNSWSRRMPWLLLTDGNDIDVCSCISYHKHCDGDGYFQNNRHDSDEDMTLSDLDEIDTIMSDQNEIIHNDASIMNDHNDSDSDSGQEEEQDARDFFISMIMKDSLLYRRRVLNLSFNREKQYTLDLPEACDKACWGSPYGWIVTLGLDRHMELLNPLTKARLPLPSQHTLAYPWNEARGKTIRTFNIDRAVLLQTMPSDTDTDPWLVVLFHRSYGVVSFAKPRDKSWKEIYFPKKPARHIKLDVLYNSDSRSLLFVDGIGSLHYYVVHDAKHFSYKHSVIGPPDMTMNMPLLCGPPPVYVVQSGGDLLVLLRLRNRETIDNLEYKTTGFTVYKLITSAATHVWEELHDLNGAALFVGNNVTMSVPLAHDAGIRSNCIYYNDDDQAMYFTQPDKLGGHDVGVYDMAERSVQPLTLNNYNDTRSSYCCPFWFSPAII